MNKTELLVCKDLSFNYEPEKIDRPGMPDFKLNDKLWVEVKNIKCKKLSSLQVINFTKMQEEGIKIIIALVENKKNILYSDFVRPKILPKLMKNILIHLEDDEYELLAEIKGKDSWKDVLMLSVKNKKR